MTDRSATPSASSSDAEQSPAPSPHARRTVLTGVVAVGGLAALAPVLAACGGDDATGATTPTQQPPAEEQAPGATTSAGVILAADEVPVGGGAVRIVGDRKVVVTQPTEGEFRGFSAVCPHQGCAVNNVVDGTIICPCHNSTFDASTGAVLQGPATASLAVIEVREDGSDIVFA